MMMLTPMMMMTQPIQPFCKRLATPLLQQRRACLAVALHNTKWYGIHQGRQICGFVNNYLYIIIIISVEFSHILCALNLEIFTYLFTKST
jgi:hypothetical protein